MRKDGSTLWYFKTYKWAGRRLLSLYTSDLSVLISAKHVQQPQEPEQFKLVQHLVRGDPEYVMTIRG
jgi:hypothetical protein